MVDRTFSLQALLETRHPELSLFLMRMEPTSLAKPASDSEGAEMLRQHFLFLWELEERNVLLASGPLSLGTPVVEGLSILACGSIEEARGIADEEPFVRAGWRRAIVTPWQLNEGLLVESVKALLARKERVGDAEVASVDSDS